MEPYIEKEGSSVLGKKYSKLTETIKELVSDFNLVSFEVLSVDDKESMINLQGVIDKANGYIFGASEVGGDTVWAEASREGALIANYDIQDRWIDNKEKYDKEEEEKRTALLKEQELQNKAVDVNEEDEWENALTSQPGWCILIIIGFIVGVILSPIIYGERRKKSVNRLISRNVSLLAEIVEEIFRTEQNNLPLAWAR